jgi:acetylornithine/N-succinyldiaminopimelate aminotransferase
MENNVYTSGEKSIVKTINRSKRVWDKGKNCWLYDLEGNKYLDFFTGHGVLCLGHNNKTQINAMQDQLKKLIHTGNHYYEKAQVSLAQELINCSFGNKVMFANSGAEIVDLSIKLARKWGNKNKKISNYKIITMSSSFHGRTYGALSASNQENFYQGIGPMLSGFIEVPFNNIDALNSSVDDNTCAILMEPVLGDGGIIPADKKYLKHIRTLCNKNSILLIYDEIQCGLGRLGTTFAYQYFGVEPDVLLLGKPLGGGLPISALITKDCFSNVLKINDHGSTFGGNPVASQAGITLLKKLQDEKFIKHIQNISQYLKQKLEKVSKKHPELVKEIRGIGLLIGIDLKKEPDNIVENCLDKGLIVSIVNDKVLRLTPPYILKEKDVDLACSILDKVFGELR